MIRADLLAAPSAQIPPVFIFVDNQFAIKAANGQSKIRANKALVAIVQHSLNVLRELTPATLVWVPGHSNIGGNDVADALAKRGAKGISSDQPPSSLTPRNHVPACRPHPRDDPVVVRAIAPSPGPSSVSTRQSKRPRPTPSLVVGIDFSLAKTGKKKKQKRTDPPTTCPHGVMYDYSSSNASIDLPALPCPTCKQAHQDAINLPYHQTEFYFGMHDPFEANYDQIEYELDDPDHPTISIQDEPWADPASPAPTSDHDVHTHMSDMFH